MSYVFILKYSNNSTLFRSLASPPRSNRKDHHSSDRRRSRSRSHGRRSRSRGRRSQSRGHESRSYDRKNGDRRSGDKRYDDDGRRKIDSKGTTRYDYDSQITGLKKSNLSFLVLYKF